MKNTTIHFGAILLVIMTGCQTNNESNSTLLEFARLSGDETISTPYGDVTMVHNFITDESSEKLFDAMDLQRASQAYIWSTPVVSGLTWYIEHMKNYQTGEGLGEFVVFESLKEKRGIVTANLTTPYIFNFFNLSEGAVVIKYPAGKTAGGVLDLWQRPLCDLGLTGPDGGKGGKYIIVGPEDDVENYESSDAYIFQSETNHILPLLKKVVANDSSATNICYYYRCMYSHRYYSACGLR